MHVHVLDQTNAPVVLALMLADGITGFRQMTGSPELLQQRRDHTLPLDKDAPALLAMPGELLTPFNASSIERAQQQVQQQKQQGADFIKMGLASPDIFFASIAAAKQAGIPILGHLQEGVSAAQASDAGFSSIEHLGPGTPVWIGCSTQEAQLTSEALQQPRIKLPPVRLPGFVVSRIMKVIQKRLINPAAYENVAYTRLLQRSFDTYSQDKCRALAERFVANGTWHTPTLVRLRTQELADDPAYLHDPFIPYIPPDALTQWKAVTERFHKLPQEMRTTYAEAYRRQLTLTKLFADSGVRMMTGTDSGGQAPGLSIHQEFDQLATAGLSPLQVLQMTTTNAADFLARSSTMGEVAPGYNADLVILDGNPLESVQNLHRVNAVVRAGFYHPRKDLDATREQAISNNGHLN
ncbi:MAG: amidohydrolase family protein [Terriglobus sp.]